MADKYFKVDVYSHHFVLSRVQALGQNVVESFARGYVQFGLVKQGRKFVKAPIKVFAARVGSGVDRIHEYRFHIQQFPEFVRHLTNMQILPHTYEITHHAPSEGLSVSLEVLPKWNPLDYQVPIISYLVSDKPSKIKLLEIQTGSGKAQPLDAKIKVPGGWKRMGDIQVNDTVTAWDGTVAQVSGVYPRGKRETYKITFSDGRSTKADPYHMWKVYKCGVSRYKKWRLMTTLEMMNIISKGNSKIYIQLCESESIADADLPINPYTLGALLGNNSILNRLVSTVNLDSVVLENLLYQLYLETRTEDEITDGPHCKLYSNINKKIELDSAYVASLDKLGLMGSYPTEKFIPDVYLNASTSQRLHLLQGLMDTSGAVKQTGVSCFYSRNRKIAEQVQYLVRSLGGIASISSLCRQMSIPETENEVHCVRIKMKLQNTLFSIKEKKTKANDDNLYNVNLKLGVKNIEYSGEEELQCISISHPDRLYITDDFIVTHNTFCASSALAELGKRFLIVIKPMYVDKWKDDLKKILGLSGDDVSVIQGSAALMNLITTAREKRLTCKAIIISNKTLQNWFKAYERKGTTEDEGYDCDPADLCSVLDVGVRLIDEVHQDFHLNFKMDLYTNISRTMSLSATLKADDPFLNRMYELTYPRDTRYAGLAYNKYIYAYSWLYQVKEPQRLRTSEWGSTIYSHHAFEKSLIQNREMLRQYLDMIMQSVRQFFLDQYKKGDRLLVYCSSIQMCTLVVARMTSEFKDLDVRRYVEEDPYENLMQADVSVSTLLSAGTGVDIPMLTTVILTTSISSSQSNIQGFGRLRNIPNKKLRFVYFVCSDLPKQLEYHEKKKDMLSRMALGYNSWNYPKILGNN